VYSGGILMEMKDIFALIETFDTSSLSKLKLSQGDVSISLQKGGDTPVVHQFHSHPSMTYGSVPPATSGPQPTSPETPSASPAPSAPANKDTEIITAPIVGTFYRTPSPDSPAFVEEGSSVKSGDTICIIEAMKVMNQLEADFDMEIVTILVKNATMVEYGAPLFEVRRI
jgi:acetyl-CoA carboxylase biotin carboxyl carrier protein